jgi:hypothetical protein
VLPFATVIGWPFQLPNHTRAAPESVISSDTIDHPDPDPLVQEIGVVCGIVTFDPDELAVDWVEKAVPPAVYPVPVISVPDAEPVLAVEVSFSFIADVARPAHALGEDIAWSMAVWAMA